MTFLSLHHHSMQYTATIHNFQTFLWFLTLGNPCTFLPEPHHCIFKFSDWLQRHLHTINHHLMGWLTTKANSTPETEIFMMILKVFQTFFHGTIPPAILNHHPITFTCCFFNFFSNLLLVAFIHADVGTFHVHLLSAFLPFIADVHVVLFGLHEEDGFLWS